VVIDEKLKGNCSLKEFLLTKQLTKHPNDYPGGKSLPHVAVAKRLKENGESDANLIGHFIHYLICKGDNVREILKFLLK
jgi:DNA polymerase alpha subunit A